MFLVDQELSGLGGGFGLRKIVAVWVLERSIHVSHPLRPADVDDIGCRDVKQKAEEKTGLTTSIV